MKKTKEHIMKFLFNDDFNHSKKLSGWWKDSLFQVYEVINNYHIKNSIDGNIGEIGVWYGKSLLPIYNFLNENEKLYGMDVFMDDQEDQILQLFDSCYGERNNLVLWKQSSFQTKKFLEHKPFRLFYVDGDHSSKMTYNDLMVAKESLHEEGLIFLDDYDNPQHGLSVREGLNKFINNTDFEITFISSRALFLCKKEYSENYINEISTNLNDWIKETDKIYTHVPKFTHKLGNEEFRLRGFI